MNDTTSAIEEVCADLKSTQQDTKQITVTYVWNPSEARYVADSDAIERLEKDNESRY